MLYRFLKDNWHVLINLGLTVFVAFIAVKQCDINKNQLQISKDQKVISEQQLSLSVKQDGLIRDQTKLSEKQFRLSSALGHQHIEPTIASWMAFPAEGPFYAWIANRGPISIVALSVECWDVAFNAKDEVKIIGSSHSERQSTDPRYFFFKPQLTPGETCAMTVPQDQQTWRLNADPARPEGSRLTRLFYILKATYYRDSDLRRYTKTFAFEIADIRTFHSKRIDSFEKHPDYQRIKFWLDKQRSFDKWSPELSGETQ